jgi:hypothetical protein
MTFKLEDRLAQALSIIKENPTCFRPGFDEWLLSNADIARRLFTESHKAWLCGVRKTGISKIIEYLRWDTLLYDSGQQFKINQAWTSSLARLWAFMYPDRASLFKYKVREGGVVGPLPERIAA